MTRQTLLDHQKRLKITETMIHALDFVQGENGDLAYPNVHILSFSPCSPILFRPKRQHYVNNIANTVRKNHNSFSIASSYIYSKTQQNHCIDLYRLTYTYYRPNCSHDDFWFEDGDFDFFVRKNLGTVDVQLVADVDILAQHTHVLHADPGADGGMPPVNTCPPPRQKARCRLWW